MYVLLNHCRRARLYSMPSLTAQLAGGRVKVSIQQVLSSLLHSSKSHFCLHRQEVWAITIKWYTIVHYVRKCKYAFICLATTTTYVFIA